MNLKSIEKFLYSVNEVLIMFIPSAFLVLVLSVIIFLAIGVWVTDEDTEYQKGYSAGYEKAAVFYLDTIYAQADREITFKPKDSPKERIIVK